VVIIDLDLGTCTPTPGSPDDDSLLLPWREQLDTALAVAYSQLRSPTEYESNPFVAGARRAAARGPPASRCSAWPGVLACCQMGSLPTAPGVGASLP
jgi:hypothetical protein